MKWVDLPPVWLAACLGLVWGIGTLWPWPVFGVAGQGVGAALALAGLALGLAAIITMTRARTTVIPHRQPAALVTGGVFAWSRNPIYLGDALILAGAVLWLDVALALPVVAGFVAVIRQRFILPEEARLRAGFGPAFDEWAGRVRRWI